MQKEILVVLGAPNTPSGQLSSMAINRLDYCIGRYKKGKPVLCTGGWGPNFNTSKVAHAIHAQQYLKDKGVDPSDFMEIALSKHTVDDAIKIKPILATLNQVPLVVITSDYHLDRVKLIFDKVLENHSIEYIGVTSTLEKEKYKKLVAHEKKAILSIIENGLYF